MRSEFRLTFDNFLDLDKAARRYHETEPGSASKAGFWVAVSGLLLLAVAYGLLRWSNDCTARVGFFFLGCVLLTPFVAVPLGILLGRRRHEKAKESLRRTFERFYAGPQRFEADENGWKYSFHDSDNLRKWSELVWIFSSGRTLVIGDLFATYAIPEPAFGKEELDQLRSLCERTLIPSEKIATASMFATTADFLLAMSAHNWSRRPLRMVGLYGLGLICVSFLALVLADALLWSAFLLATVLLPLLPIAEVWFYNRRFGRYLPFHYADISSEFICFRAPGELRRLKYRWFSDFRETKRSFRLYVSPNFFYIVPKTALNPDQVSQFRELMRSQVTTDARSV